MLLIFILKKNKFKDVSFFYPSDLPMWIIGRIGTQSLQTLFFPPLCHVSHNFSYNSAMTSPCS